MKKYIEQEAAIALSKEIVVPQASGVDYKHRCIDPQDIRELPAADVVEVRHGRWERVDYGNGCYNYHCSSCRHIPRENIRSNYCPNCGADMRGGVNDGKID